MQATIAPKLVDLTLNIHHTVPPSQELTLRKVMKSYLGSWRIRGNLRKTPLNLYVSQTLKLRSAYNIII